MVNTLLMTYGCAWSTKLLRDVKDTQKKFLDNLSIMNKYKN